MIWIFLIVLVLMFGFWPIVAAGGYALVVVACIVGLWWIGNLIVDRMTGGG